VKKLQDETLPPWFEQSEFGRNTPRWERFDSSLMADCRVFKVRRDLSRIGPAGQEHDFFCIEAPDWVNVVPLTARGEVVMIEQYRHGSEEVTLEIPGGMVDDGEGSVNAVTRELFEETGFISSNVISLGSSRPNPAIQNNRIHTYLALDVVCRQKPRIEGTEHTTVRLVPKEAVPELISRGVIDHALVILAFYKLRLWEDGLIENQP
jgi:ADP-ribose pyrophosphatase